MSQFRRRRNAHFSCVDVGQKMRMWVKHDFEIVFGCDFLQLWRTEDALPSSLVQRILKCG